MKSYRQTFSFLALGLIFLGVLTIPQHKALAACAYMSEVKQLEAEYKIDPTKVPRAFEAAICYQLDRLHKAEDKGNEKEVEAAKEYLRILLEEESDRQKAGLTDPQKEALAQKNNLQGGLSEGCALSSKGIKRCLLGALETVLSWFISLFGLILRAFNIAFGLAIQMSVVNFKDYASGDGVITAWKKVRDITNIVFIFMLLYIAIGTIFQTVSAKQTLPKVIVLALLVNFSFFFTSIPIDASNVIANGLLRTISDKTSTGGAPDITTVITDNMGINKAVTDKISFEGIEDPDAPPQKTRDDSFWANAFLTLTKSLLTIIFILITAFVVLTATILFMIRMIVLLFLLILSPLAFASMAIPFTQQYAKQWQSELINQCLFAPAFMLTFTLPITIAKAMHGPSDEKFVTIILNFILLGGLMLGAIIVAKKLGAKGAGFATIVAGTATGYAAYRMTNATKGLVGGSARALYKPVAGGVSWASNKTGVTDTLKDIKTNVGEVFKGSGTGIKDSQVGKFVAGTYGKSMGELKGDIKSDFRNVKNFITTPKNPIQSLNTAFKNATELAPFGRTRDELKKRREEEEKDNEAKKKAEAKDRVDNATKELTQIVGNIPEETLKTLGQTVNGSVVSLDKNTIDAITNSIKDLKVDDFEKLPPELATSPAVLNSINEVVLSRMQKNVKNYSQDQLGAISEARARKPANTPGARVVANAAASTRPAKPTNLPFPGAPDPVFNEARGTYESGNMEINPINGQWQPKT